MTGDGNEDNKAEATATTETWEGDSLAWAETQVIEEDGDVEMEHGDGKWDGCDTWTSTEPGTEESWTSQPEESWTSHDMSLAEGATEDPSLQCDTMAKDQATVMLPVDNLTSIKPANKGCQNAPPGAFCSDLRWRNRSGAGGKGK